MAGAGAIISGIRGQVQDAAPGLVVCCTVALAAAFISEHHGGPTLLYALLIGMAFYFLSKDPRTKVGIDLAGKKVLRVGVALLGAKITLTEILDLGWVPILIVVTSVTCTIGFGVLLSRRLGLGRDFGLLSGGATAICGASAAMAISAALPPHKNAERDTLFTVISVTTLSTVAMILYPLILQWLQINEVDAGIYLGATIHDVAQVVGASFMISDTAGEVATFTKLLRVALLAPAVLVISFIVLRGGLTEGRSAVLVKLPGFLIAFVAIVAVNSFGFIPAWGQTLLSDVSRACLVVAIAGLGVKTSLQDLAKVGWKPALLVVAETVFLACLVLVVMTAMP